MNRELTPRDVEARLRSLSVEIDAAYAELSKAEHLYQDAKANYEIGMARETMSQQGGSNAETRKALALIGVENERKALAIAEATVKAARANTERLSTQVDITRSVGTIIRSSLEIT